MLSWEIDNSVIAKLFCNGTNIINPWGFETADSSAFFSLEKGYGYRYATLEETCSYNDHMSRVRLVVQMKEGKWMLDVAEGIQGNTVTREIKMVTLEDSIFMDFVMRFRFKKECIEYVEIAGNRYFHHNTNVYYQYPVEEVFLKGAECDFRIHVEDRMVPEKMEPVMYVRDHEDEWVVHVRMVPTTGDKEVIKVCTAWAKTRPLPQWVSRLVLRIPSIRKALWYRGERQPYRSRLIRRFLNLSAFSMVRVPTGATLMWKVKMDVV